MGVLVGVAAGAFASMEISTNAIAWASVGGLVVSAVEGRVIGAIGGAIVSNLVGGALAPRKPGPPNPGELLNSTSNVGPIPVVYGSRRVGGLTLPPVAIGQNQQQLVLITVLCEGPIQAINKTYFNGVPAFNAAFGGMIAYAQGYLGTATQAADPWLLANVPGWSANDRFLGLAYIVFSLSFNQTAFPNGIPVITADIDGKLLYDPRDAGTRFSNNPALAIRDYHTNAIYGRGIASANIDDTAFSTAATDCEARVSLPSPTFTADPVTNYLNFASDQAFTPYSEVQVSNSGGGLPGGLSAATTYFAIPVSLTAIQLATTPLNAWAGIAVDITSAGTGTQTLMRAPVFTVDPATNLVCFDHDEAFGRGDGVMLLTSGTLPGGLNPAPQVYYFIPFGLGQYNGLVNSVGMTIQGVASNVGFLATSYANAMAGTNVPITSGGTGVHSMIHWDMQRYTCDAVLSPDSGWLNNLCALLASCRGIRPFTGGLFRLTIDKLTAPTAFGFTEDNIVGAWTIQGRSKKTSFNRVTARFCNPAKNWQTDLAIFDSSADRTIDNGLLLDSKISLDCVTNYFRAMMIAQIEEQQSRFGVVIQFTATIAGMQCEVGDVVPITESGYGWLAKPFRILQIELFSSDEVQITCIEYDDSIYNVSSIPQARTYPATQLPDPFTISRQIPPVVSGLEIFGQGSNTNFTGRNCKFDWRRASNTGSFEFGLEPFGADGGLLDYYFKDFKVEIHDGVSGNLLRTEYVQDPAYTYTFEHNYQDTNGAPTRNILIKVWQRTKYDQVSAIPAQLLATNPAPLLETLNFFAGADTAYGTYALPPDLDWAGIQVYCSTVSGFTPGPSNLVYDGVDTLFVVSNLARNTRIYYCFALVDTFGPGTMSPQSFFNTTDLVADSAALASAIVGQGSLATRNAVATSSASGSPPASPHLGDIWFQTDTHGAYQYDGTSWNLISDITANKIAAAIASQGALATLNTVNSGTIDPNSATNIQTSYTAGSMGASANIYGTYTNNVQSVGITTTGKPVLLAGSVTLDSCSADGQYRLYFSRNGTNSYTADSPIVETVAYGNATYGASISVNGVDTPGAGTYTYYLKLCPMLDACNVTRRSLSVGEMIR